MKKILNSEHSRREILKGLAAAGVTYSVLPVGMRAARAAGEVEYHTWSGYDVEDLFGSYIEKYDGMPRISLIGNEDDSFAKLQTGWAPDLMHPGNYNVRRWYDGGFLQAIDTSRVNNWPDIFESVRMEDSCQIDGEQFMIPSEFGNSSVIYRTDLVDEEDRNNPSWNILYDERYQGRVAMYDSANAIVQCAARVLGFDNIYSLTDEQLAEVGDLARKQRDLSRMYWSSVTELEQAMASGEVVAAYGWNQSIVTLKGQGLAVDMMIPKEGIFTWIAGFVMHKNVENTDAAYDLIDAWTSPESGAWLIDNYGYGSTNTKAYDHVSADRLAELGFSRPDAVLEGSWFFRALDPEIEQKYEELASDIQAGG